MCMALLHLHSVSIVLLKVQFNGGENLHGQLIGMEFWCSVLGYTLGNRGRSGK